MLFSFIESALIQINITCAKLLNAENCLQPIASSDEILATEDHDLETFYPLSPIIDLREKNVYKIKNDTGKIKYNLFHNFLICRCESTK